jgi:DNA-binding transcriptional LysR family regulator
VALGRLPLIAQHLADGRLVAPFPKRYDSPRGYYVLVAPHAEGRPDVAAFAGFLREEAGAAAPGPAARGKRSGRSSAA